MRYPQSLQEKVIEATLTKTVKEVSEEFNIPENIIKRWMFLDIPEEKLKVSVRQRFYNLIPLVEAQITTILSEKDAIVAGISDEEWDDICLAINKVIFDTIFKVYKSAQLESINHSKDLNKDGTQLAAKKKQPKPKKQDDFDSLCQDLPFYD